MRAVAVEDEQVVGRIRFADGISAEGTGSPLPAVDLYSGKREGIRFADLHILEFTDGDPCFFTTLLQCGVDQIKNGR